MEYTMPEETVIQQNDAGAESQNQPPVEEKQPPEPTDEKPDSVTDEKPVDEQEDKEEHRVNKVQKRIDKLTREKYQLKGELEALRRMYETTPPQQDQQSPSTGKPKRDQYETTEAYLEALTDYNEALAERLPRQVQGSISEQKMETDWNQRVAASRTSYDDWDETIDEASDIRIPRAAEEAIKTSDIGPDILYYLAKNHDTALRLSSLPPTAAAREVGKIEAIIEARKASQNGNPKPVSRAPAPIKPVKTTDSKTKRDHLAHPEDYTVDEWVAAEKERLSKKGR